VWRGEGASILRGPVRAPNANATAERWARTVRSECTDRLLILNEGHLRRVLNRYLRHYNEHRPHRGLALRSPQQPNASIRSKSAATAQIYRQQVLGGLINEYHAT
jgi:putative transposase